MSVNGERIPRGDGSGEMIVDADATLKSSSSSVLLHLGTVSLGDMIKAVAPLVGDDDDDDDDTVVTPPVK